jgi:hypothetical protein
VVGEPTRSGSEERKGPSALRVMVVVAGALLLLLAFFFGRAVTDWRNGCQDRLYGRANPVNPASVLRLPIPAEAPLPTTDLRTLDRRAPLGYRADVLMQRAESPAAAGEIFDDVCQNGWTFDQFNQYDRSSFTYGGEGDQRYCASQVIQNRFSLGYVPLCGSSRNYISYVIVQRGDALFAAYEATTRWNDTGRDANEALSQAMISTRLNSH